MCDTNLFVVPPSGGANRDGKTENAIVRLFQRRRLIDEQVTGLAHRCNTDLPACRNEHHS